MIEIKFLQIEALASSKLQLFKDKLKAEALKSFAGEKGPKIDAQSLDALIESTLELATNLGVLSEQHIAYLLYLTAVFGSEFYKHSEWAIEVLNAPGYGDIQTRVELLFDRAIEMAAAGT